MKTVAYFSAEYSVADDLPIYAGGLGILAGDIVMQAGDMALDFHAVGLVYHRAFTGHDQDNRPMVERLRAEGFAVLPQTVEVPVGERKVTVQAWHKAFGTSHLYLLDSDVSANSATDRQLTDQLYPADLEQKLQQQIVLGFGGVSLLKALSVEPEVYHLNEGHMAFAGLAVAVNRQAADGGKLAEALLAVKPQLVATKHTILHGAGITLDRTLLEKYLGPVLGASGGSVDDLMHLGGKPDGYLSTTKLVLAESGRHSGVAKIHVRAEAEEHAGSDLIAVTNGVYLPRWRAASWPAVAAQLPDADLFRIHQENKARLLDHASEFGSRLHPDHLTVVWARRMTAYKRPEMLVTDLERLAALALHAERPVQFIVSGQANPADETGVNLMNRVIAAAADAKLDGRFAYLPYYNPASARLLVQGADLWLNTPIRGQEACGTSGMKASLNGALQFSTSDGWFDEVDQAPIGWVLPEDAVAGDLYDILEQQIAPQFYGDKAGWAAKMRNNIALVEQQFSAERMLKDYFAKLYFPSE